MNVSSENKKGIDMKTITKNVYSLKELLDLNKEGKIAYHAVQKVKDNIAQWFASNEIMKKATLKRRINNVKTLPRSVMWHPLE